MIKRILISALLFLINGCDKTPSRFIGIPDRIISLAPNITETIYALGLEDKLVGATSYCLYPPEARSIPRMGGFGQYNFEAMVSCKPDLVILHKEYDEVKKRLDGLDIPYLETGSYFIADILQTISDVGTACGASAQAAVLIEELTNRIAELTAQPDHRPRVLITFSGSADVEMEQVHAFGTACIHNEMLELAGGTNVVSGKLPYAILSREAILRLNPDIIIELAPGQPEKDNPDNAWKLFSDVKAVRNQQVYYLTGDYTCIPGPRFILMLQDLASILKEHS